MKLFGMINLESVLERVLIKWMIVQLVLLKKFGSESLMGSTSGNTYLGSNDFILVKYNSSGTKQWTSQHGTSSFDIGKDVSVDSSGNIYVTGHTVGGLDGNLQNGNGDLYLMKFNSSGTKQWTSQLGTSSIDYVSGMSIDSSGNVFISGYTEGGLDGNTNSGNKDIFLVKYNSDGVLQ